MKKTLKELVDAELRETAADSDRARRRMEFYAELPEILACLSDGIPILTVWKALHRANRTDLAYNTFAAKVKRHINRSREKEKEETQQRPAENASSPSSRRSNKQPAKAATAEPSPAPPQLTADEAKQRMAENRKSAPDPGIPRFKFNNIPPPKEELI